MKKRKSCCFCRLYGYSTLIRVCLRLTFIVAGTYRESFYFREICRAAYTNTETVELIEAGWLLLFWCTKLYNEVLSNIQVYFDEAQKLKSDHLGKPLYQTVILFKRLTWINRYETSQNPCRIFKKQKEWIQKILQTYNDKMLNLSGRPYMKS